MEYNDPVSCGTVTTQQPVGGASNLGDAPGITPVNGVTVRILRDTPEDAAFAGKLVVDAFRDKAVHAVGEHKLVVNVIIISYKVLKHMRTARTQIRLRIRTFDQSLCCSRTSSMNHEACDRLVCRKYFQITRLTLLSDGDEYIRNTKVIDEVRNYRVAHATCRNFVQSGHLRILIRISPVRTKSETCLNITCMQWGRPKYTVEMVGWGEGRRWATLITGNIGYIKCLISYKTGCTLPKLRQIKPVLSYSVVGWGFLFKNIGVGRGGAEGGGGRTPPIICPPPPIIHPHFPSISM